MLLARKQIALSFVFCFFQFLRIISVVEAAGISALQFIDVTSKVYIDDKFHSDSHPTFEVTEG